ncbi:unnamed protein product [Brachionus calyciflorus]|uniref:CCHC-type domain-containing protein n=1 Tax=Brachionus calyciflorus TaxID=104777 RepID=A0A813M434_9BILA|nr:unnamed protein product [Brachionus calyciflorus]
MMYKKFQVYDWFKTLDGAKRIDFLNGMLHLCFPLELRFLGSCIEELARKDYLYLRDAELKANSLQEIQQFKDICDKITRSKMIVTLALLASNNYECARLLFEFLNVDICQTIDKMKAVYMDAKIADEFLLLLTMAANHPAFDFQMKTKMSHLYLSTENKLKIEEIISRDNDFEFCLCDKIKCKSKNEKIRTTSSSKHEEKIQINEKLTDKNDENQNNQIVVDNNNNKNNNSNNQDIFDIVESSKTKPVFKTSSSSSSLSSSTTSLNDNVNNDLELAADNKDMENDENLKKTSEQEPFIETISFEGVRSIKGTDNYKFSIKIRWSDLTSNEIHKTYSEICEFNQKLITLFQEEVKNIFDNSQLVFKENQKEDFVKEMPLVADYCSKLAKLPKEIFRSEFFKKFFVPNYIQYSDETNTSNESVYSQSNKNVKADKKTEIQNTSDNKVESIERLKNDESQHDSIKQTNRSSSPSKNNISTNSNQKNKSVIVSVANVMNHKQKEPLLAEPLKQALNEHLTKTNLNSNKNNLNHQNQKILHQHLAQIPSINSFMPFSNQLQNPTLQQLQLQTFQPITNISISSPPSASPIPINPILNQSNSLNNSRSSSPWMMMSQSPMHINNYLNQNQNIPLQNLNYQNRQANKPYHNLPSRDSSNKPPLNMHHPDELLLRYVLDTNNSSNSNSIVALAQLSPKDSINDNKLNKNIKSNSQIDMRKNSLKTKHQQQVNQHHQQVTSDISNLQINEQSSNGHSNQQQVLSPKSHQINLRSSSSCSSSSYQTPPPQQQLQQQQQQQQNTQIQLNNSNLPNNIGGSYQNKQISSPLNFPSNNNQQQQQHQNQQTHIHGFIPFTTTTTTTNNNNHNINTNNNTNSNNNSNSNISNKNKQPHQVPLLLAPVSVSKTSSALPIPFGLPQYGQPSILPANISFLPGLPNPHAALAISQQIQNLPNGAQSPSLPGSLSSLSSSYKIQTHKKANLNDNSSSKKMFKLAGATTDDDEADEVLSNNINNDYDDNDDSKNEINYFKPKEKNDESDLIENYDSETDDEDDEENDDKQNLDDNQTKKNLNSEATSFSMKKTFSSFNENNNGCSTKNQQNQIKSTISPMLNKNVNHNDLSPGQKNEKIDSDSSKASKSKANDSNLKDIKIDTELNENSISGHSKNLATSSSQISTRSPMTNLNNQQSNFVNQSQSIPIAVNNLYYPTVVPPYMLQDVQNIFGLNNGLAIANQPINIQNSSNSQNHMNQPFSQYPPFNSFQQAIPVPIHIAPPFGHPQMQPLQQGQSQMHQGPPPPPFLIPFIPPVNQQANTTNQTGKVTPTPGSSPNITQISNNSQQQQQQQINDSSQLNENQNKQQQNLNTQFAQQFPIPINQQQIDTTTNNLVNFNNMMAINAMTTSSNQQLQHQQQQQQNFLMMMMLGNSQQGPSNPMGNPLLHNKQININSNNNSYSTFQQFQHAINNQLSQLSPSVNSNNNNNNFVNKSQKSKKTCYNCGSMNHTAYECKEQTIESTTNSNNFKLNYKPNITQSQMTNEQQNQNIEQSQHQHASNSLSPKNNSSKLPNKNPNNFSNNSSQRINQK